MASSDNPLIKEFAASAQSWDLDKLYADLALAKKSWAPHTRKGLSDTEKVHLRGLLCGYSPDEIAQKLYKNAAGVKSALSETLYRYAEILTERPANALSNWQDIVEWLEAKYKIKPFPTPCQLKEDWDGAPDVSTFYGRTLELAALKGWIVEDGCRLVAILGQGGIGKTTLAVKLAKQLQDKFEIVIWRSLSTAPSLRTLLTNLLQFFPQLLVRESRRTEVLECSSVEDLQDIGSGLSQLLKHLQQHRCLLILDGIETILQPGELAGKYHPEHEAYQELIKRIGVEPHQSCLILTSREKTKEVASLAGSARPVRTYQLTGLGEAAGEILKEKGLPEEGNWKALINLYQSNPLALKIVATAIQDVFGGSVDEFLRHSSVFVGDFRDILDQQFQRLSPLEKEILYGLALERQPVTLSTWRDNLWLNVPISELICAMESLLRRALLEKITESQEVHFTLQPVVMKYVTQQLIEQIQRFPLL